VFTVVYFQFCGRKSAVNLQGCRRTTSKDTLPNQRCFDFSYFLRFFRHPILMLCMDICLEKAQSSHRNLWSIFHDNILEMAQRRVERLEKRRRDTKSNYGRQSVWGSSFIANCPIACNQYETGIHHTRGSHYG
jgi:hypothetical protein